MTSFLGDDCHAPNLFLKPKFLRTHLHLRLTCYTHCTGPDNPAQALDGRSEQHRNMPHELDEGGRREQSSLNLTLIISVFLWKLLHNYKCE